MRRMGSAMIYYLHWFLRVDKILWDEKKGVGWLCCKVFAVNLILCPRCAPTPIQKLSRSTNLHIKGWIFGKMSMRKLVSKILTDTVRGVASIHEVNMRNTFCRYQINPPPWWLISTHCVEKSRIRWRFYPVITMWSIVCNIIQRGHVCWFSWRNRNVDRIRSLET